MRQIPIKLLKQHGIQDHPKRTSTDMELRNYPKPKVLVYLKTFIFIITK